MDDRDITLVVVTDVKMPFWSMVFFMVKLSIASIPAVLILTVLSALAYAILFALVGGFEPLH